MTYISLFSGIEAASVAWKPMGWTPLAFAEIDAFPCAVLAHHYPGVPNHGDVTGFDWSAYRGRCDVVVGGSPCQSFSVAGLRGSLSDDRGNLALAYCKIIHAIDPTFSLYENVPGILNTDDNAFGCLLAGLVGEDDALTPPAYMGTKWPDAGVVGGPRRTAAWRVLDAQYFGVAQRRRRVFVLTVRGSGNWSCAEALFPLGDGLPWDLAPSREMGSRVAASLTRGADGGGKGGYAGRRREDDTNIIANCVDWHMGAGVPDDNAAQANHLVPQIVDALRTRRPGEGGIGGDDTHVIAQTICAHAGLHDSGGQQNFVVHSLRAEGFDASEDGTGRRTPLTVVPFDMRQCSRGERMTNNRTDGGAPGTGIGKPGDPAPSLAGSHVPAIAYRTSGNCGVMRQGEKTAALTTSSDPNATIITIPILEVGKGTSSRGQGPNGCGIGKDTDPMFTLQAGAQHAVAFAQNQRNELRTMDIAGACAAEPGMKQQTYVTTPRMAVRRLTPAECLKLQGFPPDYLDIIHRGKPAADNAKYRAIGNSMCVNVVRWIGERIEAMEAPTPSSRPAGGANA